MDRKVRTGSIPVPSTNYKNMYCIVKLVTTVDGKELPVIMLDSSDEIWEFDDINDAFNMAEILTKNSDSGYKYYAKKV